MTMLEPIEGSLLTIRQACEFLNCGKKKLYQLDEAGQIVMVKLGHATRVTETSLRQFVSELPRRTQPADPKQGAAMTSDDRVLTFKDLKKKGWPYTAVHTRRLIKQGKVPQPFKTGEIGLNLWMESDIGAYLAGRAKSVRGKRQPRD